MSFRCLLSASLGDVGSVGPPVVVPGTRGLGGGVDIDAIISAEVGRVGGYTQVSARVSDNLIELRMLQYHECHSPFNKCTHIPIRLPVTFTYANSILRLGGVGELIFR